MYKDFKIVVNTAAGRRQNMQYLVPYILRSDIVDRYDIWINTHNTVDIEFFKQLAKNFPKVNLVWQPDNEVNGISTINAFYKDCTDKDTIYFKLDDDVVWMEPGLIEKMVEFRVSNPEPFLVTPLVINNALSTYLLYIHRKISLNQEFSIQKARHIFWKKGRFAYELHTWFLRVIEERSWNKLFVGSKEMGMTRFSINAILWFGKEMAKFNGNVTGDDEEFLSCIYPTLQGKSNLWNGDAIVAHYSFGPQNPSLSRTSILPKYGKALELECSLDENIKSINDTVKRIIGDLEKNKERLMKEKSPYKPSPKKSLVSVIKRRVKNFIRSERVENTPPRTLLDYVVGKKD
ncbi:MAG: hypothetical protein IKU76_03035 [Bacteroidaceae bacterium]|nr:hypothetical protein [Bacteroidaceae bacterium]